MDVGSVSFKQHIIMKHHFLSFISRFSTLNLSKNFITILILFFTFPTASAQGEWKWAHYWTGSGGDLNNVFNNITNTAFDEDGNIYVYGTMGGNVRLDGEMLMFSNNSDVITTSEHSILLAKFDTLGTMLWYKVIKCNRDYWSIPKWMTVKNDRIYITGTTGMWSDRNYWLYYIDTLITKEDVLNLPVSERKPPYKQSRWTFFSQLDLDGNRIEDHFVETYTRQYYENGNNYVRSVRPICSDEHTILAPMHVDGSGNVYLFARLDYAGNEEDPYTIVIDGDSSRTYDLYLPGSSCGSTALHNVMFYKFTPNWELDFAKLMVQNTEGIATSWEIAHDSINPAYNIYPEWLSFDQEDNMYVSGFVMLGLSVFGASLHQYPIHIYFDSLHYATIDDQSGTRRLNFVLKYNTDGDILWCNQIYTKGGISGSSNSYAEWRGSCIDNDHLYLLGGGSYASGSGANIFFDNESNFLRRFASTGSICFFAKYDKVSGQYVSQGIIPAYAAVASKTLAVINNRVFATASFNDSGNILLTEWRNDGLVIRTDTINCVSSDLHRSQGVVANDKGYLLSSLISYDPVTFSDDVAAECDNPGRSHAVFALYHDPSFAEPYVGIPDQEENLSHVRIWPNPTSNILYVESDSSPIDCVTIMDLNGRIIMKEKVGDNSFVVNAARLPAGLYLLETVCKGARTVEKFVKVDD